MRASERSAWSWVLIAVIVAGLVVDAVVHLDLASAFSHNKTSVVSEATLFRAESIVALLVALCVLVLPRRFTAALAFLVAASALAAAVVTRYVNVGKIGPIPNLYDPYWSPTGKVLSVIGEAAATLAAAALLGMLSRRSRSVGASFSRQ